MAEERDDELGNVAHRGWGRASRCSLAKSPRVLERGRDDIWGLEGEDARGMSQDLLFARLDVMLHCRIDSLAGFTGHGRAASQMACASGYRAVVFACGCRASVLRNRDTARRHLSPHDAWWRRRPPPRA